MPSYAQPRRPFRRPQQPQTPPPAKAMPQIRGRKDLWTTLQVVRDVSTNTTKTTRLCEISSGVLINTCTRGPNGMCEALQYIPGAKGADFKGGVA